MATSRPHDYVSINGHTIRRNAVLGANEPPIRIARSRSDKAPRYAHEVRLTQPARLVYSPASKILACGARLVIEAPANSVEIVR